MLEETLDDFRYLMFSYRTVVACRIRRIAQYTSSFPDFWYRKHTYRHSWYEFSAHFSEDRIPNKGRSFIYTVNDLQVIWYEIMDLVCGTGFDDFVNDLQVSYSLRIYEKEGERQSTHPILTVITSIVCVLICVLKERTNSGKTYFMSFLSITVANAQSDGSCPTDVPHIKPR